MIVTMAIMEARIKKRQNIGNSIVMKDFFYSEMFFCGFRLGLALIISLAVLLCLEGCAGHSQYKSQPDLYDYNETGKASYYSMKYQFRKTASGARFNNYAMTAAHRKLPFGTRVAVTNSRNGKTVVVTINDRGPFVEGRIIDLTRSAFAKIENLEKGITDVSIKVVN